MCETLLLDIVAPEAQLCQHMSLADLLRFTVYTRIYHDGHLHRGPQKQQNCQSWWALARNSTVFSYEYCSSGPVDSLAQVIADLYSKWMVNVHYNKKIGEHKFGKFTKKKSLVNFKFRGFIQVLTQRTGNHFALLS